MHSYGTRLLIKRIYAFLIIYIFVLLLLFLTIWGSQWKTPRKMLFVQQSRLIIDQYHFIFLLSFALFRLVYHNSLQYNIAHYINIMQSDPTPSPVRLKNPITIHLCPIEVKKLEYNFLPPDYAEITQAIIKKLPLEKLLKLIHYKFSDQGLMYTLVHRVYESTEYEIEYYVPELVYIAVRKMCRPMRKVLVYKASNSQNLRRLILWNIKAFTVLMITREEPLKKFIQDFESDIVSTVQDSVKFQNSEKAIAMLATASLVLKKMPKQQIKDKLKKFIKRYNYEILNNLDHAIMIPFRHNDFEKNISSTYIVRIVEDNCSCFPTRKRVPYRIILETVDLSELRHQHHDLTNPYFLKVQKPIPDKERDLFDQVKEDVEKQFKQKNQFQVKDNKYPFVIDQQYFVNMTELNKYAKRIEHEEKDKEREKGRDTISPRRFPFLRRDTIMTLKSRTRSSNMEGNNLVFNKGKFEIQNNEQLKKFDAVFIPTLPSNLRKSDASYPRGIWIQTDRDKSRRRLSLRNPDSQIKNVKQIEEEVKYEGNNGASIWKQPWTQTVKTLRQFSPFKKLHSLKYRNMVVKGGDDLRQEIICMQLIYKIQSIIRDAGLDIFIKPYEIIVLSQNSGMLEFVANSISIDGMKKEMQMDLHEFYAEVFNTEQKLITAKSNFIRSLAGSSILTYVLKLKDRHNGNILIDIDGHIIHIDFGFIFGMSPGGINFESSPFKLTQEYVLLMGGKDSPDYVQFVQLFCSGMNAIRKRCDELGLILEIMMDESDLECFQGFRIDVFMSKFQLKMSEQDFITHCEALVQRSCMNSRTVHYDTFQKITNGIMP